MKYQIDQSGKIEQTEKTTVLAAVNGEPKAIVLPAKEKRRLQELFRRVGAPALFVDTTFATMLYLLIQDLIKKTTNFIIDIEYPGRTKVIEDMISRLTPKKLTISWKLIGKASKAHDFAYKVYCKKIKAKNTNAQEVWKIAKVASRELATKIAGGCLNIGLLPVNRHSAPANKHRLSNLKPKVKRKI